MKKLIAICVALTAMGSLGALTSPFAFAAAGEIDFACSITTECFTFAEPTTEGAITVNGGVLKCTKASYTARSQASEGGTITETESGAKDWTIHLETIHPEYSGCTFIGQTANVTTTGCNYKIVPSSKTVGTSTIACEAGKEITIEAATSKCTVKIGSQTPINNTIDLTVEESGGLKDILVKFTTGTNPIVKEGKTGIKYTSSGGACGPSGENGSDREVFTLKGYSDAAHTKQVSCTLVETLASGKTK